MFAIVTVVLTAVSAFGLIRLLRPELYEGQSLAGGTWSDVRGALVRLDLGEACMFFGCPPLKRLWLDGIWADLFLLAAAQSTPPMTPNPTATTTPHRLRPAAPVRPAVRAPATAGAV